MGAASGDHSEPPTPPPTATASQYDILARLAIGGMAEIFIARATTGAGVQRHVVLKRILPERARDPQFVGMFLREAQLAAQLHHPNIAQVHDVGRVGGSYFFTMEYVHGETVRALLQRVAAHRRQIPLAHVLTIIAGAAAGLHHAHERSGPDRKPLGVVHRDVSPSNLMVSFEGSVKLVDFGVAKAMMGSMETQTGGIKGKISYLSPEQCRGRRDVDRRSDLFSLGIVFYEMLTTTRLFRRETEFDTMSAIVHEHPAPPSVRRPDLDPDLDDVVMKLLGKKPEDRFATAGELLETIEALAAKHGLPLSPTALGRYLRELFGDRPEPWLELEADSGVRHVTVTTDVIEPIGELDGVPEAPGSPQRERTGPPRTSTFAPDVPTVPTAEEFADDAATDNPFAPDPVPVYDIAPIARSISISKPATEPAVVDTERDPDEPAEPRPATVAKGKPLGKKRGRTTSDAPMAAAPAPRSISEQGRPHVGWLVVGAVVAGLGGLLLVMHGRRSGAASGGAAGAIELNADRLGAAIDGTARSSALRINALATTPMLRAAIETDAATLEDMAKGDLLISVKPGEVLEIFQTRNGASTSMLRRPADAPPLRMPGAASEAALTTDGTSLRLVASTPIKGARPGAGGAVALAVPIDLQMIKQHLASARLADAKLVGLDQPIPLVTARAATGDDVAIPVVTSIALDTKLAIQARVPQVTVTNTMQLGGFVGLGLGGVLLAFYIAGLLVQRR